MNDTSCGYGQFEENGSAYIINTPDTPQSWDNYLYSSDGLFQAIVSQRGMGSVTYNHGVNLVSTGRNYCLVLPDGKECWSLTGGDAPNMADDFRCIHRPNSTTFHTLHRDISAELEVVLAKEEYVEQNQLRLENKSTEKVEFSLIGYHSIELKSSYITNQMEESTYINDIGAILLKCRYHGMPLDKYIAFYVSDRLADSYCGSLEEFIGSSAPLYRAAPFYSGKLPNTDAYATRPILALQHDISLDPGEKIIINFTMGIADDISEAEKMAYSYHQKGKSDAALITNRSPRKILEQETIKTPDEVLNRQLNVWTKLQLHRQTIAARMGMRHNWRNNLQDAWGWMIFDPSWARVRLKEICMEADADGFLPRTTGKVPSATFTKQYHTDIATWAGICAARYAAETGDIDFFNTEVEYAEGTKKASVGDCLINGLMWLLNHRGKHGMILLMEGDWSDPLEAAGKRGIGESPWTTVAVVNAIKEIMPLVRLMGKSEIAALFSKAIVELTDAVNTHAWDGEWYIRGITDDGVRFCTSSDSDGKVSLLMQAWSIISGVIPEERVSTVLQSVKKYNKYDEGIILYGPPFMKERPELGRESAKKPGTGENGSVYTHAAQMWIAAEIALGNADEALRISKLQRT